MYGTITRYRIKPGAEDTLRALSRELVSNPPRGFVAAYVYKLDSADNEFMSAAIWTDSDTYRKNSDDERQQQWFSRLRDILAGEPEWNDGEVIEAAAAADVSAVGVVAAPRSEAYPEWLPKS